jgi:hypothetical protein
MQLYINENRGQFVSHREEIVDEHGTQREREEFVNPRPRGAHHKHLTNDRAARHDRAERCGPRAPAVHDGRRAPAVSKVWVAMRTDRWVRRA